MLHLVSRIPNRPAGSGWRRRLCVALIAMALVPGWSADGDERQSSNSESDQSSNSESSSSSSSSSSQSNSGSRFDEPLIEPGSGSRERRRNSRDENNDDNSGRSRRDRENENPDSASQAANVGGQSQTGAAVTRRSSGARVSAITGAARAPEASRAPSTSIRFTYKITNEYPVLYFDPPNLTTTVGDVERVDLKLHNPRRVAFDRVLVAIQYDPLIVRFKKVDLAPIIDQLSGSPTIHFDAAEGLLAIEAYFSDAARLHDASLAEVDFEALQPVPAHSIRLVAFPFERRAQDISSGLYYGQKNILGQTRIEEDGVIPLGVEILPDLEAASESETEAASLAKEIAQSSDPLLFGRGARGGIVVSLEPERRQLAVGEEVDVAIQFFNPAYSQLDYVNLQLEFDPRVLEVVDWDRGNAIARAINLHEGSRTLFPFDYQLSNEANNRRGTIEYRMGTTGEAAWPRKAAIATIRLRALRPTPKTRIEFAMPDRKDKGTAISFVGRDVVGDPDDPLDGFEGCTLKIGE